MGSTLERTMPFLSLYCSLLRFWRRTLLPMGNDDMVEIMLFRWNGSEGLFRLVGGGLVCEMTNDSKRPIDSG